MNIFKCGLLGSTGRPNIETCCVVDLLHVAMQGAFELISSQCPKAVAGMLDGMARRLSAASAARANPNQYATAHHLIAHIKPC